MHSPRVVLKERRPQERCTPYTVLLDEQEILGELVYFLDILTRRCVDLLAAQLRDKGTCIMSSFYSKRPIIEDDMYIRTAYSASADKSVRIR